MCIRPATSCCGRRCALALRPPWAPGAATAESAPPRVGPAQRYTRCSVSIRSTGAAAAAPAVACVHYWGAGAGTAGCSSRHGSTCTNPRTCCSTSSRASWTSPPRRHPVGKLHPTRAERRVRYWRSGRHRRASEDRLNRSACAHAALADRRRRESRQVAERGPAVTHSSGRHCDRVDLDQPVRPREPGHLDEGVRGIGLGENSARSVVI